MIMNVFHLHHGIISVPFQFPLYGIMIMNTSKRKEFTVELVFQFPLYGIMIMNYAVAYCCCAVAVLFQFPLYGIMIMNEGLRLPVTKKRYAFNSRYMGL